MKKLEYIRSVLNVFAKSPFKPLAIHASKGTEAVLKLSEAMDAYFEGDMDRVMVLSEEIDMIEHEADVIKQAVRSQLSSSIMLPVNAEDLLNFLKPQDSIADVTQDVAYWLTLQHHEIQDEIKEGMLDIMSKTVETAKTYEELVGTLSDLLETSFSKKEVEEALSIVPRVEELEHEVDVIEKRLVRLLFKEQDQLGGTGVYHLTELIFTLGKISDKAENASDRLRTMILRR
ncbi:MAG: TIGR00153 family protein [Methanosarcinaceae archaeon]